MKQVFFLFWILIFLLFSCRGTGIRGWFPGYDEPPPTSQNNVGCSQDVLITYKNNCDVRLIMYFVEITPGDSFKCETLSKIGYVNSNQMISVTIHKGKLGYVVFAIDEEGQCTGGHRKFEGWVDCSKSNGDSAFNICP